MIGPDGFTPRQLEFQSRLSALVAEYAYDVGPEFGGDLDEGIEMEMPMALGWILITQWTDVAGANSSTVRFDSGTLSYPTRVGLMRIASRMVENE